MAHVTRD